MFAIFAENTIFHAHPILEKDKTFKNPAPNVCFFDVKEKQNRFLVTKINLIYN